MLNFCTLINYFIIYKMLMYKEVLKEWDKYHLFNNIAKE